MQKKIQQLHSLAGGQKALTCGHNNHSTTWEMHFPAVSLYRAGPWHFKYAFTSGFNSPASIFACLLTLRATKEDREEVEGEKSQQFLHQPKLVSKCVLHLCTLLGPPSLSCLVLLASWRAEWLRGATLSFYPASQGLPISIVKNINCRGVLKTRKAKGRDVKCHIFP